MQPPPGMTEKQFLLHLVASLVHMMGNSVKIECTTLEKMNHVIAHFRITEDCGVELMIELWEDDAKNG